MNFTTARNGMKQVISMLAISVAIAACNNEGDKTTGDSMDTSSFSGNQSGAGRGSMPEGSTATVPGTQTSTATGDSSSASAAKARRGRVSAMMAAEDMNARMEMDKQGYYGRAEVAPMYSGGQASLESYVQDNLQYPQTALDNDIEGEVKVQFAVDNDGKVSNVSTIGKKIGYGLEEEAIKVVSGMPKWKPGMVKGKAVKTWRTLPITYKLES